jgi:hypothetical protein
VQESFEPLGILENSCIQSNYPHGVLLGSVEACDQGVAARSSDSTRTWSNGGASSSSNALCPVVVMTRCAALFHECVSLSGKSRNRFFLGAVTFFEAEFGYYRA